VRFWIPPPPATRGYGRDRHLDDWDGWCTGRTSTVFTGGRFTGDYLNHLDGCRTTGLPDPTVTTVQPHYFNSRTHAHFTVLPFTSVQRSGWVTPDGGSFTTPPAIPTVGGNATQRFPLPHLPAVRARSDAIHGWTRLRIPTGRIVALHSVGLPHPPPPPNRSYGQFRTVQILLCGTTPPRTTTPTTTSTPHLWTLGLLDASVDTPLQAPSYHTNTLHRRTTSWTARTLVYWFGVGASHLPLPLPRAGWTGPSGRLYSSCRTPPHGLSGGFPTFGFWNWSFYSGRLVIPRLDELHWTLQVGVPTPRPRLLPPPDGEFLRSPHLPH